MLHPTSNRRERILNFGTYGAGKTYNWCMIRAWARRTNSPSRFYVIDADHTVEAMADGWDDFYENCTIEEPWEWDEFTDIITRFRKQGTRDDWLVVDSMDKPWESSQAGFTEKVFGKDITNFFIEQRREMDKGHPFSGSYGVNWNVINKMYAAFQNEILRFPGHVFLTAPADQVQTPNPRTGEGGDDAETLRQYQRFGVKPRGQKLLGHLPHTVLLSVDTGGGWKMTTVKDRQRERMTGEDMKDFVVQYLVRRAGWKL